MDQRETGFQLPDGEEPEWFTGLLSGDTPLDSHNMRELLRAIASLNSNLDLDSLVVDVVDLTLELAGGERGLLLLYEGKKMRVRVARNSLGKSLPADLDYSHSIPEEVATTGKSVFWTAPPSPSMFEQGLRTVMCVPLRVKNRITGVLYVDSRLPGRELRRSRLELLKALACQVAIALDNARLLVHYAEKERIRQELRIARTIQQRFLPRGPLSVPGFEIHGVSIGCEETSGDYFDFVPTGEGRLGIVIGDVSGHGVGAALLMATARAHLRSFLFVDPDPAAALRHLNAFLCRDMEEDRFMTLFYADLDIGSRRLGYVRAGHNPSLLFRRDSGEVEELMGPGVILGKVPDFRFRVAGPVVLRTGDVLLLYTDGIVEAMDARKEQFGPERVAEHLLRHADLPPAAICDGLRAAVDGFAGHAPMQDDLTLVVAKAVP